MKKSGISLITTASIWMFLLVWRLFEFNEFNASNLVDFLPSISLLFSGVLCVNQSQGLSNIVGVLVSISGLIWLCRDIYLLAAYQDWLITPLNIFWTLPPLGMISTGLFMLNRRKHETSANYKTPSVILLVTASVWICLISYQFIDGFINDWIQYMNIDSYFWIFVPICLLLSGIFMLQEITPVKIDLSPSNVNNEPVTVGDWLLTYFLLSLPVVNLIMLLVWAFNQNEKQSKSNWAKAFLIWTLIVTFIYLLILVLFLSK